METSRWLLLVLCDVNWIYLSFRRFDDKTFGFSESWCAVTQASTRIDLWMCLNSCSVTRITWVPLKASSVSHIHWLYELHTLLSGLCETYSVPGGSSRQLGLLQQHHVLHATFGQVIGHADPHTSTTDDDGVRGVLPPFSQNCGSITEGGEAQVSDHSCSISTGFTAAVSPAARPGASGSPCWSCVTGCTTTRTGLTSITAALHEVWLRGSTSCAALRAALRALRRYRRLISNFLTEPLRH